jgi:hypothetical protein
MAASRDNLDWFAFAAAIVVLSAPTLWFVAERNGAAAVMCGLLLAGLFAGRLAGVPGTVLLPVSLGLALILWMVWFDPVGGGPQRTSALAHGAGGLLAGWALAITLRRRLPAPEWALAALLVVGALTIAWELGEYLGDSVLDTSLVPSKGDSAFDIFFGGVGGAAGIALAALLPVSGRARTPAEPRQRRRLP